MKIICLFYKCKVQLLLHTDCRLSWVSLLPAAGTALQGQSTSYLKNKQLLLFALAL